MGVLLRASVLACLALCACQSAPLEPGTAATGFVQALNAKDIDSMAEFAATPFRVRNQPWENAPDGSGFVLGAATERVANSSDELRAVLQDLAANVRIAEPAAVGDPPSKADLLSEPLRGAPSQWNELDLVLFRRGEGDVEHIAIVGVDAKGKVTGLYVN